MALLLAIAAGMLTTIAGVGGGQVLLLGLAWMWDPRSALTVTGPALLIGNAHRLTLFRAHLQPRLVLPYVLGALPGSLLGGALAVQVPSSVLELAMIVMAGLAAAKVLFGWKLTAPPGALAPGGLVVGAVAATGGGAGLLGGPLLLSAGLTGRRYIAAGAAGALSMHIGRLTAYSAAGWVSLSTLGTGLALAVGIVTGNAIGKRLRGHINGETTRRIEVFAILLCVGLALTNLG